MLTRLRLTNFRSHGDTALDLGPINLLIGPAAGGKSNIFKALVFVQNSVHRSLVELFPPGLGEFHWVRSRWAGQTDPIGFEVELEQIPGHPDWSARYSLRIADSPEGIFVVEETLARKLPEQDWQWVFQRRYHNQNIGEFGQINARDPTILNLVWHQDPKVNSDAPGPRFAKAVGKALSRCGYFHLEASRLRALGSGQTSDRIGYFGDRLPDFLAHLKSDPDLAETFETIRTEMGEVLPGLKEIIVTQVGADRQGIAMSFAEQQGYIAAPELSDGTLFTLGLLCIIHGPKQPGILCIEEPESGLHPRRLRWLFDRLMDLAYPSEGRDPIQVVLSSHSPYLVDYFREMQEFVQLVERQDGRSRITPLTAVQEKLHQHPENQEAIGHQWATGLFEGL